MVTGHSYDEIWAAALKVAEEHFWISERDRSGGVITAERAPARWRGEESRYVGIYITPPAPGADRYFIEVVTREPQGGLRGVFANFGYAQNWEEKVPRNIQQVLAGQPMRWLRAHPPPTFSFVAMPASRTKIFKDASPAAGSSRSELGYVEGRNLVVKGAFAKGSAKGLPRLVGELLRSGVDVMVTTGTRETIAARRGSSTIPIVMWLVPDPVGQGFVATLAQPGGNVTGLTNLVPGLVQKYVEFLHEAVPAASRFAVVANPPNPVPENRRELEAASKTVGVTLSIIPVNDPGDFDGALAQAKRDRVGAILVTADPVTFLYRKRLVEAALKHQLPGIYWAREFVEDGGLMSYSANLAELLNRAAVFVDKILKGARYHRNGGRSGERRRHGRH
jgi:putative ABC transport system substrate-binding protein